MDRIRTVITRIRIFYDPTREPLRRRVYTSLATLIAVGVTAGAITGAMALSLGGFAAAVLVIPAVEAARSKVTPLTDPVIDDTPGRHAVDRVAA